MHCVTYKYLHGVFVKQQKRSMQDTPFWTYVHMHIIHTFVSIHFQQINVIKVYMLREANRMGQFHLKEQKKIVTNVVENYFDVAFSVKDYN